MQMPTSTLKNRGKSATIISDQINLLNVPTEISPLKIESVTPALSKNANRTIHHSYSTLSLNYLRKLTADGKNEIFDQRRRLNEVANETSDCNANENNGSIVSSNSGNATAVAPMSNSTNGIQHGFWRIQRTTKERDKFPDRINLDRRGLTTLPIIDNEPNLRLLSLQHNLINSFCVPGSGNTSAMEPIDGKIEFTKKSVIADSGRGCNSNNVIKSCSGKQSNNGRRLLRTQSIQKPSSSSSSLVSRNFYMNNNSANVTSRVSNAGCSGLNAENAATGGDTMRITSVGASDSDGKNGTTVFQQSNVAVKNSLIQKSMLLHTKQKYMLKKSSSFINNYSRHLMATKAHLGRLIQNRATNGTATLGVIGPMSSFSSDSTQEVELRPPAEMMIVKNDPFSGFADSLHNLVFLDLYDNQIERISNLDGLRSLTVLLLGKNRIIDISGVVSVKNTLRVLDLHGNKISNISQKICQLQELKSLNLAGNSLKQISTDDFRGLMQLKELNLKRNKIKKIVGFDDLRCLERLWLCHNDLQRVEDMSCVAKAINLREITIENNPVSLGGDCVSFLVSYLPSLASLSQMPVTEQVRRAAMAWRKSKETTDANYSHLSSDVSQSIRREEVISNARTNWELLRSQQQLNKSSSYIHKAISSSAKQLQMPISETEAEVRSNLSENVIIDRKIIRQKTQMIRKNLRKPMIAIDSAKRSLSQDNILTASDPMEFHLPPIVQPLTDYMSIDKKPQSVTSSVGGNVDSTSSHFSSDNESEAQNAADPSTTENTTEKFKDPINVEESDSIEGAITALLSERKSTEPTTAQVVNTNVQLDQNSTETFDNFSDLSTNAAKLTPDSTVPLLTVDNPQQKCKSASQSKRSNQNQMQRAQTARLINPPMPLSASSNPITAKPHKVVANDRDREQGGDYLIEICGRYLNVYGSGAIKFIDRQWNTQKANDVHTLKFSYVNFSNIITIFSRIKNRFPNAEHYVFRETNINCLGQLNALAEIQGITSLTIDPEGNAICTKPWRLYAIYRLAHWGIKTINEIEVTEQEIDEAQSIYEGLSDLVLWSLPESLIEPLLLRLHLDETCSASKMSAKQWLMEADASLRIVVGKEALQCKLSTNTNGFSSHNDTEFRYRGRSSLATMMENTYNAVEKLQKLETLWPAILLDLIKNTLKDYSQMDAYIRNIIADINVEATTNGKR